jgi:hypothetical protein
MDKQLKTYTYLFILKQNQYMGLDQKEIRRKLVSVLVTICTTYQTYKSKEQEHLKEVA